jgi:hypothetical protein
VSYIKSMLDSLSTVEGNYVSAASAIIGPGEYGTSHVPSSDLEFSSSSSIQSSPVTVSTATLCPSSSGGGTPDCTNAVGDAKILCAAEAYSGIYYEYGGAHVEGYEAFAGNCPDPSNPIDNKPHGGPINGDPGLDSGNPGPCGLDCSSLVSVAVDSAFGLDYMWAVLNGVMVGDGSGSWKSIDISQATPGDIVTIAGNDPHVEIVMSVDAANNTVQTFGAHETGQVIGPAGPFSFSTWSGGAWEWTGQGSND